MNYQQILQDTINDEIGRFNKTRGRRKELKPQFVAKEGIREYRKVGRILEFDQETLVENRLNICDCIQKMGQATVRTMLKTKPRPAKYWVGIHEVERISDGMKGLSVHMYIAK